MQDASNILAFMKRVYLIFMNWHLLFEDFIFKSLNIYCFMQNKIPG